MSKTTHFEWEVSRELLPLERAGESVVDVATPAPEDKGEVIEGGVSSTIAESKRMVLPVAVPSLFI